MKKILLLAAGLVAALSVSAQTLPMQASVQKQNPTLQQEVQKQVLTPSNSIVKANVANNKVAVPVRKSNYSTFGWMNSHSFANNYAGSENLAWTGGELDLFPDSIAIVNAIYFTVADTTRADYGSIHKVGGVFDPYSKAFSSDFDKMLYGIDDTVGESPVLTGCHSVFCQIYFCGNRYFSTIRCNPDTHSFGVRCCLMVSAVPF